MMMIETMMKISMMTTVLNNKDSEDIDYTNPQFNWDMFDEGEVNINNDNPFLGL